MRRVCRVVVGGLSAQGSVAPTPTPTMLLSPVFLSSRAAISSSTLLLMKETDIEVIPPEGEEPHSRGGGGSADDDAALSMGNLDAEDENLDDEEGDFDVEEAAAQEVHDLVRALNQYHHNVMSGDYGKKQRKEADQMVEDMMQKLFKLLTPSVFNRIISNSEKIDRADRTRLDNSERSRLDHRSHYRNVPHQNRWDTNTSVFPQLVKHAPHELHSLRSDLNPQQIEFATALRDKDTLDILQFKLTSDRFGGSPLGFHIEKKLLELAESRKR